MPLYEYSCRKCSKRFERLVFGKEKPTCPKCDSADLQKLVSTFAAHGGDKSTDSFGSDSGGDFGGDPGYDPGEGGDDFGTSGMGGCGSCGDPRGPGSCGIN
jgi:putative FmdB family regulatory protein